jgi:predicted transcriptional regulator
VKNQKDQKDPRQTTQEVADELGTSSKTVLRTMKSKGIKVGKLVRSYRWTQEQKAQLVGEGSPPESSEQPQIDATEVS